MRKAIYVWNRGHMEIFVPSSQICYESKMALKNKLFKKMNQGKRHKTNGTDSHILSNPSRFEISHVGVGLNMVLIQLSMCL